MQTKTCTKCHIEKLLSEFNKQKIGKYGVRGNCRACQILYYEATKESKKLQRLEYNIKNKQYKAEYDKAYRNNNKQKLLEKSIKYRNQNKVQKSKYDEKYRLLNKDRIYARIKEYKNTEHGKLVIKASNSNRRAKKRCLEFGKHTAKDILSLLELQSYKCSYCECKLHKSGKNKYHVDHIMPLSKGGSNRVENLQILCPKCNLSKQDKLPEEFAAKFNKLF